MGTSTAARGDSGTPGKLPEEVVSSAYQLASRLMDSLLHDARNPLNALAINLEVLVEKLRAEGREVPAHLDKNLKAMRDQVFRVDTILKKFSDFIAPKRGPAGRVDVSQVVQRAVEVLGHESRRRQVRLSVKIEPGMTVQCADASALNLMVAHPLMRALQRSPPGSQIEVKLARKAEDASLEIIDAGDAEVELEPEVRVALEALCDQSGFELSMDGGHFEWRAAASQ